MEPRWGDVAVDVIVVVKGKIPALWLGPVGLIAIGVSWLADCFSHSISSLRVASDGHFCIVGRRGKYRRRRSTQSQHQSRDPYYVNLTPSSMVAWVMSQSISEFALAGTNSLMDCDREVK